MNNEEKILAMLAEMKAAQEEMKAAQEEMRSDISEMKDTLTRVSATQEDFVLPKLQLLYEGHKTIMEAMDNLTPKYRTEAVESDVSVLKDVVKITRTEISDLKKAQ